MDEIHHFGGCFVLNIILYPVHGSLLWKVLFVIQHLLRSWCALIQHRPRSSR